MVKEIYLQRFNIRKQLKRDATVCCLGKRRQGKTTIMENIAFELQFKRVLALCGSLGAKKGFQKFMPHCLVFTGSVKKLQDIVTAHSKWVNKHPDVKLTEFETAIFIDDMAFSQPFMRSGELKELALNGRQLGLFVCISVQYMMEMTPSLRGNLDYVIMTKESSRTNREKIFKQYGGTLSCMAHFDRILEACTQDYGVLVIDTTATSNSVESYMYHYRANADLPAWKVGEPVPASWKVLVGEQTEEELQEEEDGGGGGGSNNNQQVIIAISPQECEGQEHAYNSNVIVGNDQTNVPFGGNNHNNTNGMNGMNNNITRGMNSLNINDGQFDNNSYGANNYNHNNANNGYSNKPITLAPAVANYIDINAIKPN